MSETIIAEGGNHRGNELKLFPTLLISFLLTLFSQVAASTLSGEIISVLDGDTIEVLHNQHPEHIRLNGIDCQEKGQAYGQKARYAASAFAKEVTLQTHSKDKYELTVAMCFS
jgi:endonuclease YncB( thermonuclease family)